MLARLLLLALAAAPAAAAPNARDADRMTPLLRAAFADRRGEAFSLIKAGADVDARSSGGLTPLMLAAMNGDDALAARLLAAGADARLKDPNGQTALSFAVAWPKGRAPLVRRLIDAGADVNAPGIPKGATPLYWAAGNCRDDVAAELLARGAVVDAALRVDKVTPLMQAAVSGCLPVARRLLAAGADPGLRDSEGLTAAQLAARFKHSRLADVLDPKPQKRAP